MPRSHHPDRDRFKFRLACATVDEQLNAIGATIEAMARRRWRPPPAEEARRCDLAACRRHRACQSDAVRRACERIPFERAEAARVAAIPGEFPWNVIYPTEPNDDDDA
ncbi:hypothetical protein [Rhizobium sp. EC-SD404]|uniref:hypothetical protein n=1 Tax=Rhizobium sp. EC-SD404 TaxID=2038389 RepID=UPI00125A03F2|nr:hypothetical protein [Rhizobium sp. EC-SD404]VVT23454.1 hypothetical protein RHIZ404_220222 [Rhizobium sp. EC-SD404]